MDFKKLIKADDETLVTKQGFTYDQLSESAKEKVREWLATDNDWWDVWGEEELGQIVTNNYGEYDLTVNDLSIDWDSYGRCSVDLKHSTRPWPAFKKIFIEAAKQVLKDLPMFQNKPELLEDWSAEAGSDMYYDGGGCFETYNGLNNIDGYDGYELSYKIAENCEEAYETTIRPVLDQIENDFQNFVKRQEEYIWSDEYAKEICEANEYLFDEYGRLI